MDVRTSAIPPAVELLARHYATAGPLMASLFGPIPFAWAGQAANGGVFFHGPLSPHTRPKGGCVDVPTHHGMRRYAQLSAERIAGLARHGAVEIHSWSPTPTDPTRVAFARIVLATTSASEPLLPDALIALRRLLEHDLAYRSIPIFDGARGAALWIPFTNAPTYPAVRAWLERVVDDACDAFPALFSAGPVPPGSRSRHVHLHVTSNAVGRFSGLPYTARARDGFPIALPVDWDAVPCFVKTGGAFAGELDAWLDENGDPFGAAVMRIGAQPFVADDPAAVTAALPQYAAAKTHGPVIAAAIAVLEDGRSHTADDIHTIALQRELLETTTTTKYVYTSLIEYIARANGNGRKPAIVQNPDRTFRMNEPADDWPALDEPPAQPPSPDLQALIDRLNATASGHDAAAFEAAVCDAFEALGFAATHLGGQKAPDGYVDALLGPLGYRAMLECKSAGEGVNDPNVFEAAKFREPYGARYCALVARAFSGELELTRELHNHGVSAWTVADLQTLLRIGADSCDIEPLFAPGFAADALDDLLWERRHGRAKRVRLIVDAILTTGRTTQRAYHGRPQDAPHLTEDVAMVLVDQELAAAGSTATCSRDDVRAAIDYLANPLVARIRKDADGGIVVVGRPSAPAPVTSAR